MTIIRSVLTPKSKCPNGDNIYPLRCAHELEGNRQYPKSRAPLMPHSRPFMFVSCLFSSFSELLLSYSSFSHLEKYTRRRNVGEMIERAWP